MEKVLLVASLLERFIFSCFSCLLLAGLEI